MHQARNHWEVEEIGHALLCTEIALHIEPGNVDNLTNKGCLLAYNANADPRAALAPYGRISQALALFVKAMKLNHGYKRAHACYRFTLRWTGENYAKLKRYKQAMWVYKLLIDIDPKDNHSKGELYKLVHARQYDKQSLHELREKVKNTKEYNEQVILGLKRRIKRLNAFSQRKTH